MMQNNFMPSKAVIIAVTSFLLVVLICSSSSASARLVKKGPITCVGYGQSSVIPPLRIACCQEFTYSNGVTKTYCTDCANTQPPSDCQPRYQQEMRSQVPTTAGNALPPPSNSTGTPPLGSTIKVSPGTIGSATSLPPTNNSTGNPITMKSSDNPPGCSKQIPIPLNCTLNPFNNSASNKGTASLGNIIKVPVNHTNTLPTGNNSSTPPPVLKLSQPSLAGQQTQTQQTTGHHHKGSNTGASTSGGNSTGH